MNNELDFLSILEMEKDFNQMDWEVHLVEIGEKEQKICCPSGAVWAECPDCD